jgi:hypothetical protein
MLYWWVRVFVCNFSVFCGEVGGWRLEVGGNEFLASNLKRSAPQTLNRRVSIWLRPWACVRSIGAKEMVGKMGG